MGELTAEERGLLSDWWLSGSEGDLFAVVERILAARRESLAEPLRALRYAQAQAITEHARGRADEERAWLDMCALLDDPALPSRAHGNGPRSDAEAGTGSRGHRESERGSNDNDGIRG
jgi:hypothetical protein